MCLRAFFFVVGLLPSISSAASAVAQLSCTDTECTADCQNGQWNINECFNTTGGNSQIFLSCDSSGVQTITYTGQNCQGQGTSGQMDTGKCVISETDTSFINTCVSSTIEAPLQRRVSFAAKVKSSKLKASRASTSAVAQLSCSDNECVDDCSNTQWNLNQCYNTTGGNSQIFLSCDDGGLNGLDYTGTGCQGQGTTNNMDVGKCLVSETGSSFINTCVSAVIIEQNWHMLSSTIRRTRQLVV